MSKEIDISDRTNFELPNIGLPQRNKLKNLEHRFLSDTVRGNRRRTGFGREVRAGRRNMLIWVSVEREACIDWGHTAPSP